LHLQRQHCRSFFFKKKKNSKKRHAISCVVIFYNAALQLVIVGLPQVVSQQNQFKWGHRHSNKQTNKINPMFLPVRGVQHSAGAGDERCVTLGGLESREAAATSGKTILESIL
jgi:hypothetical protein